MSGKRGEVDDAMRRMCESFGRDVFSRTTTHVVRVSCEEDDDDDAKGMDETCSPLVRITGRVDDEKTSRTIT